VKEQLFKKVKEQSTEVEEYRLPEKGLIISLNKLCQ
jgi:hypothetical protein